MGRAGSSIDIVTATLLLAAWTVVVVVHYQGHWAIDMSALYLAGHFAADGNWAMVYGAPPGFFSQDLPSEWVALQEVHGVEGESAVPYVYPPLWAALLAPLATATDPHTFFDITRIATISAFAASILVGWRFMRPAGLSATAFALIGILIAEATVPFRFLAVLNQPQAIVMALTIFAFERYASGRSVAAGVALGLAAAIKVSPILLAVIFLADRDFRALGASVATAAGLAALSLVVAGAPAHLLFVEQVRALEGLVTVQGFNLTFETVIHNLAPWAVDGAHRTPPFVSPDTPWVSHLSRLLLLAALPAALWVTARMTESHRLRARVILIFLAVTFFGPLAWIHYYALILILVPGLLGMWSLRRWAVVCVCLASSTATPMMLFLLYRVLETGNAGPVFPQHIVLPAIALVAALLIRDGLAARRGTARPDAPPRRVPPDRGEPTLRTGG